MSTGYLVFVESRGGQLRKASLEALSEAVRKANGQSVTALLIGSGVKSLAEGVGKYGAAKVLVADSAAFASYSTEAYADALVAAVKACSPRFVFAAHTAMARDFVPRVAARLDAPCVADVMEIKSEGDNLLPVRPMYSGKCFGVYEICSDLSFITLRPNVFALAESAGAGAVEDLAVSPAEVKAKVADVQASQGSKMELSEASIIVSGGRGIKGPENWPVLQSLCDALGAALGASRAVVDAGWIDHQFQVGQTGKTVSPQLYIACGISGAIQHLAGMSSSKVIVAINKDPDAPIFKHATYGIVGDVLEIVPKLTEEVRKLHEHN
ncbi:MAG: electron transfer flavoprotein subunit alpha/FixB family protein [Cyanobacteria bacterium SZAS LIN-2]|nr:electron transfer flavoprotein subunit alpha/FixB family protein [Cyanobacteria bacterium SZAS LIN-3]MBS1996004.1 electron transfer flavoprotein subunit alpha/FixB family protein [Cyanobacteria bacterium SZAS LIN-2]MBS2007172.1 electron transfer flavoprotein subunit alpha/FixB family protein [Cyanobacteria bacterium SZAS TMP-1]